MISPVRQGRRRGGRPGQVRLPRPHHAHDPRLGGALHPRARPGVDADARHACRSTTRDLQLLFQHGNTTGGLPVRIARHARHAAAGAARPLRGHHRAGRAVSARADGPHPDFIARKHGEQRVEYLDPRLEPILSRDLRHHGVPGAGDADRAGDRRLHAGRRRPAAPRDGQEEARGDGDSSATSSSPGAANAACREPKATSSST